MKSAMTYAPLSGAGTGRKDDESKERYDLVLPEFERDLARVLTYGAKKYDANSWQKVDGAVDRYYAALRRHLAAWRAGEKTDKESGLPHLAHAACNVMFLSHFEGAGNV